MPSLPHVVSSLFRGHQVLGDRAPELQSSHLMQLSRTLWLLSFPKTDCQD